MQTGIIIVLALALVGVTYAYACSTELASFRAQMFDELLDAFDLRIEFWMQYQNILDNSNGGIGERIEEFRSLVATIALKAPELLSESPRLLDDIRATDQFLVQLKRVPGLNRPHIVRILEHGAQLQRPAHESLEQQKQVGE